MYSTRASALLCAAVLCPQHAHSDTDLWQYPGNQHFYKQYNVNLTVQNAYRFCTARGGYVVSIGDAQENSFFAGMLRTSGVQTSMIGLTLSKRVMTKRLSILIGYELQGRWADGSMFRFKYEDNAATPPPNNSFERFDTQPEGIQAHMNARGVWSDKWLDSVLARSAVEVKRPFTIETYTVKRPISSITCEWNTAPANP